MKGDILFEKMAGISDEYIAEAALVQTVESIPTVDVTPAPKKRFPPYLIGGLAAACVCFVVSVAALVGMVAWGLTDNSPGNTITPSAPSFPISPGAPLWQRFDFTYAVTDGEGLPLTAALPGDTVLVDTTLTNRGLPFFYSGSSSEYCAYAEFVLQGNESVTMQGGIFHTTDVGTFPVLSGEVGQGQYFFTIPENAVPGVYDLELSYGGASQKFEGVLTIAEPTVEAPAVLSNLTMPVGSEWLYEPIDEAYVPGEFVTVRIQFATDVGTLFFLNGEVITTEVGDDRLGYWEYSFYMPDRDSEIIFHAYDGTAPYSDVLEAYYIANPKAEGVLVSDYGTFGDGVRVAIIDDARFMYTQMEEEHRIGHAIIRYSDGCFMQVLYNGVFYSLADAYGSGLLSDADMAALENLQREWNPHLYADDE